MTKEQLLKEIVKGEELKEAPKRTRRYGKHYEFLVDIGKDDYAMVTMFEDAYKVLMEEKTK